jgi:GMP synthase-like glutamine amidotransferase
VTPPVRALVLQHLPVEHPGSVGRRLAEAGVELVTVELDHGEAIPDLDPFDLLVVMGGPMDVGDESLHPWLVDEKAAIRSWVAGGTRPFLGVCLGHQLLADALGGRVGPMDRPEVGVVEIELEPAAATDPLFGRLGRRVHGLQWHSAEVRSVPDGAVVLATTPACAVQAFRVGRCAWGVQFHVEAGSTTVPEWATVPEYRAALSRTGVVAGRLQADVAECSASMEATAAALTAGLVSCLAPVPVPHPGLAATSP